MERVLQISKDIGCEIADKPADRVGDCEVCDSWKEQWTGLIGIAASTSLYDVLAVHPKPGMISFKTSCNHSGADSEIYLNSINALIPWFERFALEGSGKADFAKLQELGIGAEEDMLAVTGGISTHRGAIFLLGLICAAAGKLLALGSCPPFRSGTLGQVVMRSWANEIPDESKCEEGSNGLEIFKRYGVRGARSEARRGYYNVYKFGVPVLKRALRKYSFHNACVQTFFSLMSEVKDTALYAAGGSKGQGIAAASAKGFLATGGVSATGWREAAEAIHERFIENGLRAGGVTNLLSTTLLIKSLEK